MMGREGKLLLPQYIAGNSSWLADNSTVRKAKRLQYLTQTSCERVAVRLVRQPCVLLALHNHHHHHHLFARRILLQVFPNGPHQRLSNDIAA